MGKVDTFQIFLQNDVFLAGSVVNGTVKLTLSEPLKTREVRLQVSIKILKFLTSNIRTEMTQVDGKAHTQWTESHSRSVSNGRGGTRTETHSETYSATEPYIDLRIHMWPDSPQGSGDETMPAGQYAFPFAFQIPAHCPSSFVGSYGSILYVCKVRHFRFRPMLLENHLLHKFCYLDT